MNTSDDISQAAILRQELAAARALHGHSVYLQVSEDEARDIAAGCLPQVVIAQARYALSGFDEQIRANAQTFTRTKGRNRR